MELAVKRKPPKPYVFRTIDELRTALENETTVLGVSEFLKRKSGCVEEIVRDSVGHNTFRAFHIGRFGLRPSVVYRTWATRQLEQSLPQFRQANTVQDMRLLLLASAHALRTHWMEATDGRHDIGFGRSAKLLNLSFKHLLWHDSLSSDCRKHVAGILDVPLDSFTLQGVRLLLPQFNIPAAASMRFVGNEEHYCALQDAIRVLVGDKSSPVHYETLAWNLAHPEEIKRLLG